VIGWALAEMLGAIAPIGQNLATKLRATALDRPQFAAASFVLGDALPQTRCDQWKEERALVHRSAQLITTLLASNDVSPQERAVLGGLQSFDHDRTAVIDAAIAAQCPGSV